MADLSVTATGVVEGAGAIKKTYKAGATITAGMSVYLDTSNLVQPADADAAASAGTQGKVGIALNGGAINQSITVQFDGEITIGATVAVGQIYVVSSTAGGIAPYVDLTAGDYLTILGVGKTTAIIAMNPFASGIVKA